MISLFGCKEVEISYPTGEQLSVRWEQVSNVLGDQPVSEARFIIENNSQFTLKDYNWSFYFNQSPRKVVPHPENQPARVEQISGDWYRLVPNEHFKLEPGEKVEIRYRLDVWLIKEADAPAGSYFVFKDKQGEEKEIVVAEDFQIMPFAREEQTSRHKLDKTSVPTPESRYQANRVMSKLDDDKLLKLIPSPSSIQSGTGKFILDKRIPILYSNGLVAEAQYLADRLKELTGTEFEVTDKERRGKVIRMSSVPIKVGGSKRESYILNIGSNGVSITGNDKAGVFYAIQSLLALVPFENYQNTSAGIEMPCVKIEDAPRFNYRGLHLDVARNFQTKESLLKMIDLLAFYKINVLHLHLTDDEGWRFEVQQLPELTEVAGHRGHTTKEAAALHPSYGSGPVAFAENSHGSGFYTREEFIEILEYAHARHIKIIPEVNFPGHARAAIKAMEARYERLMEAGDENGANEFRLIDPDDQSVYSSAQHYSDNVVNVARESVYDFYMTIVDALGEMYAVAGVPFNEIHTGGDEVPEGVWTKSPMVDELLKTMPEVKDPKNLQSYFFRRLLEKLENRKLAVGGWEEVALVKSEEGKYVPNPEFVGRQVYPYVWNNLSGMQDLAYNLANEGYDVVLCSVSSLYFDLAYNKDPQEPGLYWGGLVKTYDAWSFNPYDLYKSTVKDNMGRPIDIDEEYKNMDRLKPEAVERIKGIQAQLWSETIKGEDMLQYYTLPKLIGFAERAWSKAPEYETVEERSERENMEQEAWNIFANSMAKTELPRLNYLYGGFTYRLPTPGLLMEDNKLKANVEYPGLEIRYTTDGIEPSADSPLYEKPVEVKGEVKVRAFDAAGNGSRTATIRIQ